MALKKTKKVSGIGTFNLSMMTTEGWDVKWIDGKFKAKITLEVIEEPCRVCGKLATGNQLCQRCEQLVCDDCAKIDDTGRYCPICFGIKKQIKQ